MIKSLAFVLYPVSDLAAARKFYEGVLGLRLTREFDGPWFEYDLGDTTFAICATDAAHPVPVRGGVVAFEVDDLDAEIQRLKALGIVPAGGITDTSVCRFISLRDPDGSEVLVHQRKANRV
jgi:catechol 2,3-dioxygenase-like lactoylglutathione lyase family enzyme